MIATDIESPVATDRSLLRDIGSLSSVELENLEEALPVHEETHEDYLTQLLLEQDIAFFSVKSVDFRQFPSILYAHTEDGTPFERLKQMMHPPLSLSAADQSSQVRYHWLFSPHFD